MRHVRSAQGSSQRGRTLLTSSRPPGPGPTRPCPPPRGRPAQPLGTHTLLSPRPICAARLTHCRRAPAAVSTLRSSPQRLRACMHRCIVVPSHRSAFQKLRVCQHAPSVGRHSAAPLRARACARDRHWRAARPACPHRAMPRACMLPAARDTAQHCCTSLRPLCMQKAPAQRRALCSPGPPLCVALGRPASRRRCGWPPPPPLTCARQTNPSPFAASHPFTRPCWHCNARACSQPR